MAPTAAEFFLCYVPLDRFDGQSPRHVGGSSRVRSAERMKSVRRPPRCSRTHLPHGCRTTPPALE
eukprot:11756910-Alexandrium_andersonii.AAC.1